MTTVVSMLGMDGPLRAIIQGATRRAFADAVITTFSTLEEALKGEAAVGEELLILTNPDSLSVTRAVEATDATGLRRWAIVILGATPIVQGVETVSPEEWSEPLLAHVFRSALAQHQLLRQNERMRGDLRTWCTRISHDLRTPLGGIATTGEVLKEMLAERIPPSAELVKPLFNSVGDLEKLIERVSLLTKACANPVAKKSMAMGDAVWDVLQRQERQILKSNAVVTQPDSWPEVQAVASWMEMVWGNLVSNAWQHGTASPRIELGWSQHNHEFRFWVSDNGSGIPPEKLGTLFQPFHMLHHSNARKGLGLSIVQRLVELQGGRCGHEVSPLGGSTFFFTLPVEKNPNLFSSPIQSVPQVT